MDWQLGFNDGLINRLDAATCGGVGVPPGAGELGPLMTDYVTAINEYESARQIDEAAAALITTLNQQTAALPAITPPSSTERNDGHDPSKADPTNAVQEEAFAVPFLEDTIQKDLGILYPNPATPIVQPTDIQGPGGNASPFGQRVAADALANWNNADIDQINDNCANFVSHALYWAGYKMTPGWNAPVGPNENPVTQLPPFPFPKYLHPATTSFTYVPDLYNYVMQNGGTQVPLSNAQPGDILFWEDVNPAPGKPALHHTAIVTGITSDGQILYTQHTGSLDNAEISQRQLSSDEQSGLQRIIVVRLNPPPNELNPAGQ